MGAYQPVFFDRHPSGRPINAVTKEDWEGVGVEPDVSVAADDTPKMADIMALEKQLDILPADLPGLRNEVAAMIPTLRKQLEAAAAARASAVILTPVPASKTNEDFESGTLDNWRIDRTGAGNWFIYSNGKIPPDRAERYVPTFRRATSAPRQVRGGH